MKLKINPVGNEPISLEDAKAYLQVDYDEDDKVIIRMIKAARQYIETMCGISIIEKEIELSMENYSKPLLLPYGPVKSVESLTIDGEVVEDFEGEYIETGTAFEIEYTTGFDPLPEGLEQLIYDILKLYYDARGTAVEIPLMTRTMISTYSRNLFI